MVFNLPSDEYRLTDPQQPGQYINFVLREGEKIGPRTYEVSGEVTNSVPGIYILAAVIARTKTAGRTYSNGYQFTSPIALRVYAPTPVPERAPEKGDAGKSDDDSDAVQMHEAWVRKRDANAFRNEPFSKSITTKTAEFPDVANVSVTAPPEP